MAYLLDFLLLIVNINNKLRLLVKFSVKKMFAKLYSTYQLIFYCFQ